MPKNNKTEKAPSGGLTFPPEVQEQASALLPQLIELAKRRGIPYNAVSTGNKLMSRIMEDAGDAAEQTSSASEIMNYVRQQLKSRVAASYQRRQIRIPSEIVVNDTFTP
jgi:hypothetical protein